jgi:hypothetical protein
LAAAAATAAFVPARRAHPPARHRAGACRLPFHP